MRTTWRLGLVIPALATPLWITAAPAVAATPTASPAATRTPAPAVRLPGGTVGDYYSAALDAGRKNLSWTFAGGQLPAGLTLSPGGTLAGTPTAAGTDTFSARASGAGVCGCMSTRQFTITIGGASPPPAPSATPRPAPSWSGTPSPSGPDTPSPSWSETPAPSDTPGVVLGKGGPPSGGDTPTLPVTGANLGTTAGLAALLIALGLVLAVAGLRCRRSR